VALSDQYFADAVSVARQLAQLAAIIFSPIQQRQPLLKP